jgi:hypothetical protein
MIGPSSESELQCLPLWLRSVKKVKSNFLPLFWGLSQRESPNPSISK